MFEDSLECEGYILQFDYDILTCRTYTRGPVVFDTIKEDNSTEPGDGRSYYEFYFRFTEKSLKALIAMCKSKCPNDELVYAISCPDDASLILKLDYVGYEEDCDAHYILRCFSAGRYYFGVEFEENKLNVPKRPNISKLLSILERMLENVDFPA